MFALEATVWREFFAEVFNFFFGIFLYFARGTNISNYRTERLAFLAGYEFLIGIFFKVLFIQSATEKAYRDEK